MTGTEFRLITGARSYEFSRARKFVEQSKLMKRVDKRGDRRIVRLFNTSRGTGILKRIDHAIEADFLALIWRMKAPNERRDQLLMTHSSDTQFLSRLRRHKQLEELKGFLAGLSRANSLLLIPDSKLPRHYFDERDYGFREASIAEAPPIPKRKSRSEAPLVTS